MPPAIGSLLLRVQRRRIFSLARDRVALACRYAELLATTAPVRLTHRVETGASPALAWEPRLQQVFGNGSDQRGDSIAFDSRCNLILGGTFAGATDLGGATLTGSRPLFVAKLDGAGNHVWSKRLGGASELDPLFLYIAVDPTTDDVSPMIRWPRREAGAPPEMSWGTAPTAPSCARRGRAGLLPGRSSGSSLSDTTS
ncbi:hypothetical protein WME94_21325 [Sorangium sp. So ce429]